MCHGKVSWYKMLCKRYEVQVGKAKMLMYGYEMEVQIGKDTN